MLSHLPVTHSQQVLKLRLNPSSTTPEQWCTGTCLMTGFLRGRALFYLPVSLVYILLPWPRSSYQCDMTEPRAGKRWAIAQLPIIFPPYRGTWVAQLVKHRLSISVQVIISWFVSLSPTSDSALTVWSLIEILSLPLSLPFPHLHSLYLSLKKKKTVKTVSPPYRYNRRNLKSVSNSQSSKTRSEEF